MSYFPFIFLQHFGICWLCFFTVGLCFLLGSVLCSFSALWAWPVLQTTAKNQYWWSTSAPEFSNIYSLHASNCPFLQWLQRQGDLGLNNNVQASPCSWKPEQDTDSALILLQPVQVFSHWREEVVFLGSSTYFFLCEELTAAYKPPRMPMDAHVFKGLKLPSRNIIST